MYFLKIAVLNHSETICVAVSCYLRKMNWYRKTLPDSQIQDWQYWLDCPSPASYSSDHFYRHTLPFSRKAGVRHSFQYPELSLHSSSGGWFTSVQSLSREQFFVTPWTTACQASLSITNCQSLPKPMSIESVMPSNHLILCRPLLLLPSIFPNIRVFSNESGGQNTGVSALTSVLPMNTQDRFPLGWTGWISLQSKGLSRVFSNTTVQKHQFFCAQPSL